MKYSIEHFKNESKYFAAIHRVQDVIDDYDARDERFLSLDTGDYIADWALSEIQFILNRIEADSNGGSNCL